MEKKKIELKSQKTKTQKKTELDFSALTFNVDEIEQEIEAVFKKHLKKLEKTAGVNLDKDIALTLDKAMDKPKGFYCIFMKRDDTRDDKDKYSSVALGFDMKFDEIWGIMTHTLANLMKEPSVENIPTA